MFELVQALFGRSFASSAVNSALGTNVFDIAFIRPKANVCFVAGQPLGNYSSWPLFALSHHLVVWFAAEQVYPGERFTPYAILGDDVLIADDAVNKAYRDIISRLGVRISESKTISYNSGAGEFAKRFRVDRMTVDLSPLSIRKVASSKSPLGWYYYISTLPTPLRVSTQLRIAGFGFKAASRPLACNKHGRRARRLLVMRSLFLYHREVGFELALALVIGKMVPPEVVGRVVDILFERLAQRDPDLPPAEALSRNEGFL